MRLIQLFLRIYVSKNKVYFDYISADAVPGMQGERHFDYKISMNEL